MNEIVSIIVPVYNTKSILLKRCIESVINQTYKNIEILIIDDGSKKETAELCDFYRKDDRVLVFHLNNGGPSKARNYGISKSKGRYLCFVDSDDWLAREYIEELYKAIKSTNVSIVRCNYIECPNKQLKRYKRINRLKYKIYTKSDMDDVIKVFLTPSLANETYTVLLIIDKEKIDINYNINFSYLEDIIFYFEMLCKTKDIYFLDKFLYFRSVNENGITISKKTEEKLELFFKVKKELLKLSQKYSIDNVLVNSYFNAYIIKSSLWYIGEDVLKYKGYKNFKKIINKIYDKMDKNNILLPVIFEDLSKTSKIQINLFARKKFTLLYLFYILKKIIRRY